MADNYQQTAFTCDAGTSENATKIVEWINGSDMPLELANRLRDVVGEAAIDVNKTPGDSLWTTFAIANAEANSNTCVSIYSQDDFDVDALACILQFAQETMPEVESPIAFQWAWTCSKPRDDEFGGSACIIQRDMEPKWFSTSTWISEQITTVTA